MDSTSVDSPLWPITVSRLKDFLCYLMMPSAINKADKDTPQLSATYMTYIGYNLVSFVEEVEADNGCKGEYAVDQLVEEYKKKSKEWTADLKR